MSKSVNQIISEVRGSQLIICALGVLFFLGQAMCCQGQSVLKLPRIFGDNMVLQRGSPMAVWGTTASGAEVRVTLDKGSATTKADASGKWRVSLPAHAAGGPYQLVIASAGTEVAYNNILVGDVWIASGQSNMDRELSRHLRDSTVLATADKDNVRLFLIEHDASVHPLDDLRSGTWKLSSRTAAKPFSAIGYYFATELAARYGVPIGIIESDWGGTPVQSWMSRNCSDSLGYFKSYWEKLDTLSGDLADVIRADDKHLAERRAALRHYTALDDGAEKTEYDDRNWETAILPGPWTGEKNYVWFRKSFTLKKKPVGDVALWPGNTATRVDAWINGKRVVDGYFPWMHSAKIPPDALVKGKNILLLRTAQPQGLSGLDPEHPFTISFNKGSDKIALSGEWKYNTGFDHLVEPPRYFHTYPSVLFNAMIYPMIPFSISGVIWYQGESNADKAFLYRRLFPAMIHDWRKQWHAGNFPFLYVQLANFMNREEAPSESEWAELREAQTLTRRVQNTGMAVIIDLGEARDIHPRNKWDVAHRLALLAGQQVYKDTLTARGPDFRDMRIDGPNVTVFFNHANGGLVTHGETLEGFAVAGADHVFHWAIGTIKNDAVVLHADAVPHPVAVRYAWANNPAATLYNQAGLPAEPFRTDDWDGLTKNRRY